jgi:hypothetical protein
MESLTTLSRFLVTCTQSFTAECYVGLKLNVCKEQSGKKLHSRVGECHS